ncbi:MAG: DUF6714 family protein [Alphaproteobacteria bacterium]
MEGANLVLFKFDELMMQEDIEALLTFIAEAFKDRAMPETVIKAESPDSDLYEDAQEFTGKAWQQITCAELQQYYDAIFGFSPEAFRYFLPGIYCAGIRENQPNLIVNSSLVSCLDRGNAPNSWDDFFAKRWPQLSPKECEATQKWLLWLSDCGACEDIALSRAFDTLNILANQKGAIPIASWVKK